MPELFSGARLKANRARQHVNELDKVLAAHIERGAGKMRVKKEAQFCYTLVFVAEPMPDDIPLILGDAIHNLRAALDHVAWELIAAAGGVPGKNTYFPICETREKLIKAVEKGEMKIAGPTICSLIIDTIQPYKNGKSALWPLHDTDITDKHRLLVPVVGVAKSERLSIRTQQGGGILNFHVVVAPGNTQGVYRSNCIFTLTTEGKPTCEIYFPADSGFGTEPLIPTLNRLCETVVEVIDSIERTFNAPN